MNTELDRIFLLGIEKFLQENDVFYRWDFEHERMLVFCKEKNDIYYVDFLALTEEGIEGSNRNLLTYKEAFERVKEFING